MPRKKGTPKHVYTLDGIHAAGHINCHIISTVTVRELDWAVERAAMEDTIPLEQLKMFMPAIAELYALVEN